MTANWEFEHFFHAYCVAALWSSTDTVNGEHVNLDDDHDTDDIEEATLKQMRENCEKFWETGLPLINEEEDNHTFRRGSDGSDIYQSAGHDFWLTQNGHGAGFWDGDWPTHGEALTEMSKVFSEMNLYVGDDGKIYGE